MDQVKKEVKNTYIFPDFLAKAMSKIDMRTQFEASMLSMTLMLIGMIITIIYFVIYFDFQTWYKIVLIFNGLAGFLFMSSYLTTTYQQYVSYMEITNFQKELNQGGENA